MAHISRTVGGKFITLPEINQRGRAEEFLRTRKIELKNKSELAKQIAVATAEAMTAIEFGVNSSTVAGRRCATALKYEIFDKFHEAGEENSIACQMVVTKEILEMDSIEFRERIELIYPGLYDQCHAARLDNTSRELDISVDPKNDELLKLEVYLDPLDGHCGIAGLYRVGYAKQLAREKHLHFVNQNLWLFAAAVAVERSAKSFGSNSEPAFWKVPDSGNFAKLFSFI